MQRNSAQLWGKQGARGALIAGAAAVACCLPAVASAAPASPALAGAVSPTPTIGTPTLVDTGTTEQIRQLVQCGGTMFAVGTFTQIKQGSTTYTRNNAFSFSATTPFAVNPWDPNVNGTVDTIAFDGSDCSHAYLGGHFTTVGGAAAKNIAEVDTGIGALVPGFKSNPSGGERAPAGGRCVQGHQRQHRQPILRQPQPGDRQGRRVRAPEHLRALRLPRGENQPDQGLQPAAVPRRHAGPGRRGLHLGRRRGQAADLHARPGRPGGSGHRLEFSRVGRQPGQPARRL